MNYKHDDVLAWEDIRLSFTINPNSTRKDELLLSSSSESNGNSSRNGNYSYGESERFNGISLIKLETSVCYHSVLEIHFFSLNSNCSPWNLDSFLLLWRNNI
jgi:hypothetical protein